MLSRVGAHPLCFGAASRDTRCLIADARALEPGQRPRGQRRRQSVGPVEGMALPARERRSKQLSEGQDRGTVSPGEWWEGRGSRIQFWVQFPGRGVGSVG